MAVRNDILELSRTNRLRYGSVPLPEHDLRELHRRMPDVLRAINNSEIFEFEWENSGISLDDEYNTHYPEIEDWEWLEGIACPVPHPFIWLQTRVTDPAGGEDRLYIWNIQRQGMCGYLATPLVYHGGILSYFGTYFELHPEEFDLDGRLGRVEVFNCLESYAAKYEIDEFFRQAASFSRFFRILSHPDAEIEVWEPSEKLNRARIRKGKEALLARRTVRIDSAALQRKLNRVHSTHSSPAEHHRRAHTRVLADGRRVSVRNCVVNPGKSPAGPPPQVFSVR